MKINKKIIHTVKFDATRSTANVVKEPEHNNLRGGRERAAVAT